MNTFKLKPIYVNLIGAISMLNMPAVSAQIPTNGITVYKNVKHDVSRPLREMPAETESERSAIPRHIIPLFHLPAYTYSSVGLNYFAVDTALQTLPPADLAIPINTFTGVGVGLGNFKPGGVPPDTNGSVGLTQYVQWVNSSFAVFDKATGNVLPGFPKAGNSIWTGFGGLCETTNRGDPIVKYDQLANRWVMTQFAFTSTSTPPFLQCIAVSTTSDPTGSYNRYSFQFDGFNDYPKLGVWPDAYYMTFNIFGGPNSGARACAVDRSKMLSGLAATMQCSTPSNSGTLLPVDLDGTALPPAGNPGYFLTFRAPNTLNLYKYHVDFTTPANSTFTGPTTISVASFTIANRAAQPNTSTTLDTLSDRLMYRLAYRQFSSYGTMVVNHAVQGTGGSAAIRWYEIRFNGGTTTPALFQQGTFSPDANNRFMGSIAMDKSGNIAVGYSESNSTNVFPSIYIATRAPTDPAGVLANEQLVTAGSGSQTGIARWGDYTSMAIDPADDCTFWYTNEYLKTTGSFNWSTSIANFKLAGCNTPKLQAP